MPGVRTMPARNLLNKLALRKLVIVAIAGQILVLAYMAGKREYIQASGEQIYLRSAPIDPRDPFRGDFVRLRYDINTIHQSSYRGIAELQDLSEGAVLYAVLKPGYQDVYTFDHLTDRKPTGAKFIKGRLNRDWSFGPLRGENQVNVKYGIEQYFVQQGKGKDMEAKLGERDTLQIPVEMRMSLGGDGTAVITGHRWSQLGIHLELIRVSQPRANENEPVVSPIAKITLQNVSENALTLPIPADNCALSLIRRERTIYEEQADQGCDPALTNEIEPVVLNPDETYSVELDFSDPRWHILHEGKRMEMAAIDDWQQFRVVINIPQVDGATTGSTEAPVWSGELETPMFTVSGRID